MSPAAEEFLSRVGRLIRERREALGFALQDITDRGGPSASTLSRIENGLTPNVACTTLLSIAEALGMTWAELTGLADVPAITDREMRLIEAHREIFGGAQ